LESLKDSSLNEQLSIVLIGHRDEKVTEMAIAASLLGANDSDLNCAYHESGMRSMRFLGCSTQIEDSTGDSLRLDR
jgi:hypothetical protein